MSTPRLCIISGSFVNHREQPVQGLVRFTPSRLWVVQDDITWACLAPTMVLDREGRFVTAVTATDNDSVPWVYRIETPAGVFESYVPWSPHDYCLPELLRTHGSQIVT